MSVQASCFSLLRLQATHTAEQHLKPDPNAICHTRSPRRTFPLVSMLASTYLRQQRHNQIASKIENLQQGRCC